MGLLLSSALIGGLQLELTYRDPFVPEPNQKRAKAGLSTVLLDTTHGEFKGRQHGFAFRDGPEFDQDVCQLVAGESRSRVGVRLGRVFVLDALYQL